MGRIGIGLLLLMALTTYACQENEDSELGANTTAIPFAGEVVHYENTEIGFSFDYPDDWEQIAVPLTLQTEVGQPDIRARVVMGRLDERTGELNGIAVTIHRLSREVSDSNLDEALQEFESALAQLADQAGGVIQDSSRTELGGREAARIILDFRYQGDVPSTSEYIITARGEFQFELNCQAERVGFPEISQGCRAVFDSFEFLSVN